MNSVESSKTRDATVQFLLRHGESSASELANSLGISVQAMRRHLRSLEKEGFVKSDLVALGPGRPFNLWVLTTEGKNLFNKFSGSERFALDLLNSLESNLDPELVNNLLTQLTLDKASFYCTQIGSGEIQYRLKKLVELLNKEGYLAEFQQSKDDSLSWYLNAFHCSITGLAERYPVLCENELLLIRQIFPDYEVRRVQWRFEQGHSCGFQITPVKADE